MALSNDLISQFVKATQDKNETKKESTAYGKIVKQGDVEYVQLDGSDLLTPITSTTVVKDGDRVIVTIKDHTAIVTGDLTTPSANTEDVKEIGNKITEFEIVIADKISTEQLEAEIAKIDKLIADEIKATNIKVETIEGKVAEIDTIKADVVEVEGKVTAHEAEFKTLRADIADFKDVTAESVEAIEGEFHTLESDYADFKETTTNKLTANEASINDLDTKKLDAESAKIIYANIDFSNIGEAAIQKLFSESGIIKDLIMSDGKVTGELVGVTIKGDLIEGNTLKADKLVILGEDGLYYKLNVNALGEATASSDEKYQNGLDGSIIVAESITAEKIAVDDLVAFGATIGGYHISTHSLYSGVKNSATNTTRGVFLGDDGQMAVGDSNNYLRFFIDENGKYKLEIQAESLRFGAGGSSIEDVIKDGVNEEMNNLSIGGTNLIRGTNSVTKLTTDGTWNNGTWRAASSGTGTRTNVEVIDSPNSNIKIGWHITSTDGQVMIAQDFVPTSNEQEYTLSCYAKGSGKVELQYGNTNVGYQYKQIELNSDTEWIKCSYTFKSKGEGNVYFGANGDDGVNFTESDVYICGMKLEKGTIATDWSPSIDNIVVGGRNLLVGTSTSKIINVDMVEGYIWNDIYSTNEKQTLVDLGLKVGDEVAISFDWSISQNGDLDIVYGNFRVEWYGIKDGEDQYIAPIMNPADVFSSTNTSGKAKMVTTLTEDILGAHTVRIRVDNSVLTLSISKMKMEIGNSHTDWTPAPEDIDSDIADAKNTADNANTTAGNAQKDASEAKATSEILKGMIANLVTDENGASLMTQTPDGWTFNMGDINDNLDTLGKEMDAVERGQVDTNDALGKLKNLVDSVAAKTAYITISTDDSGSPCIELGKTDNEFKVRITNTAIDFLEGSTKIAYVNNKAFYTEKIIVKSELRIGTGPSFVWKTRANGNMGLSWIS